MKKLSFLASSLEDLREFLKSVKNEVGLTNAYVDTERTKLMKSVLYESVWDAIADTSQEAASMKARSKLMMELSEVINSRKLIQKEAAELFGVTQPRISDLMRGKIHLFSLDMLMDMASTAGMRPEISVSKPRIKRAVSSRASVNRHHAVTAHA